MKTWPQPVWEQEAEFLEALVTPAYFDEIVDQSRRIPPGLARLQQLGQFVSQFFLCCHARHLIPADFVPL